MIHRKKTLGLVVLVVVASGLTVIFGAQMDNDRLNTRVEQSLYILNHEKWYENIELWKVRGWTAPNPPNLAPTAIAGYEVSELLSLMSLNLPELQVNQYLERFVHHGNDMVSIAALSQLVKRRVWTREKAAFTAQEQGLDISKFGQLFEVPAAPPAGKVSSLATGQAQQPLRSRITPEEWTQPQTQDKLTNAIYILDNQHWYEKDEDITRLLERDLRQPIEMRTGINDIVGVRENQAFGIILQSNLSEPSLTSLLTKYLEHSNESVAYSAFLSLVKSGTWSADRAIAFVKLNYPTPSGWHTLLTSLPTTTEPAVRKKVARYLLISSQNDRPFYAKGTQPKVETDATRVLLSSLEQRDLSLIRDTIQQFPDAPLLWAIAGRLPPDEKTIQLARKVYGDKSMSLPARCAAALVFGKDNPKIMNEVVQHILSKIREFGSM